MSNWKGNYRYFTKEEMQCKCGCEGLPQHEMMVKLDEMREIAGFPFVVTSGYRCSDYNSRMAGTGPHGPHTTGLAVDLLTHSYRAHAMIDLALEFDVRGIGVRQKGLHNGRFLHFDWIKPGSAIHPRPTVWSY